MPIISQYWFADRFFAGPFSAFNQHYPRGGWAWIAGDSARGTLAWNRPDEEQTFDLGPALNNALVLDAVDKVLGNRAERRSRLFAAGLFWPDVPYHHKDPARHADGDMLVQVRFNFHVNTPWYCTAADGNIAYYLVLYLDQDGHVNGSVDGWSYDYSGGGPFCTGGINDALKDGLNKGFETLQGLMDTVLRVAKEQKYSFLYYLPGSGTKTPGSFSENASEDLAVALLPR